MEQPCNFLVYHCLVLPDGLMTRAPAGSQMVFDPYSLKMTSCWGWSGARRNTRRKHAATRQRARCTLGRRGGSMRGHFLPTAHADTSGRIGTMGDTRS